MSHITQDGWVFGDSWGISSATRAALDAFLDGADTARWLAGGLHSGRVRYRSTKAAADSLGCNKIYLFPNAEARMIILVGADSLDQNARKFFSILSLSVSQTYETEKIKPTLPYVRETPARFQDVFYQILADVSSDLHADAAAIAVKKGDIYRITTGWNCAPKRQGMLISPQSHVIISSVQNTRTGQISRDSADIQGLVEKLNIDFQVESCLVVPILVGVREIGIILFLAQDEVVFDAQRVLRAQKLVQYYAASIETAISFGESERQLERFALLNELASAASLGLDIEKMVRRVLRILRQIFNVEKISIVMLDPGTGRIKQRFGRKGRRGQDYFQPDPDGLTSYILKNQRNIRINAADDSALIQLSPDTQSAIGVALKYQRTIIGTFELESTDPGAFSQQDEQLLEVIASQLAGFIENVRLTDETLKRAHNLSAIHRIVRQLVGLNDEIEVAQLASALMAASFSYELVMVLLLDESGRTLRKVGAGGSKARLVVNAVEFNSDHATFKDVLAMGKSSLSAAEITVSSHLMIPNWVPGSRMCVPLWNGEQIFGVVLVEQEESAYFVESDLLVLESMGGILSSVMMNTQRYRLLQITVSQLQAVRETSLDITELDMGTLFQRVVQRARDLVGAKGVELGLYEPNEKLVRILVADTPWGMSEGNNIPLMMGVAGHMAALGEPLVVNNYNEWKGRLWPEKIAPFHAVAGVPLKFKGDVIGTLTVIDDRPARNFHPEDVQLLQLLAPQIAVSIRNARLFQDLQAHIDAQKLTEKRLIESARLAAVGEIASGVAHELNNPLTTIAGFAELILDDMPADYPQRKDLELILQEALRARSVVRRLLDFSRQSELAKDETNINEVIGEILAIVNHLARDAGVEIRLELWDELTPVVANRNQMKQVMLNLVYNGLQAMPGGGVMVVQTMTEERDGQPWNVVQIHDSGIGIPVENLQRIFEPFFTTKPMGIGTGLGLSISQNIINEHGGEIQVSSQEGEGTCFTIWLPLGRENDAE